MTSDTPNDESAENAQTEQSAPWCATVITLFPELFPGPLACSVVGQALKDNLWTLDTVPIREHGIGKHRTVDDTPAGGGAGMVLRADVIGAAIDAARQAHADERRERPLLVMSPRGQPLTQKAVHKLSDGPGVILLAGRFEGIDERVLEARNATEVSIGDYVLSGGELAAYVLIDACARLLPGVLGASESLDHESFEDGLLEYPQYTRPRSWEGLEIPNVLLSGDHAKVKQWRSKAALDLTKKRRPDLLDAKPAIKPTSR
ncbi:MAG: tRNA (guanosine(37)-N1)-methyltransferase TrmD [Pseudomonadota bacterium]